MTDESPDQKTPSAWDEFLLQIGMYAVFVGLPALLGAVGVAYLALGVGALLLLLPYAVIVYLAIRWWRRSSI